MQTTKNLIITLAAAAMLTACGGNNDNKNTEVRPANAANDVVPTEEAGAETLDPSGATVMRSEVMDMAVVGETEFIGDYPELAGSISDLDSVTMVHATDADTWDFYSEDQIIMTVARNENGELFVSNGLNDDFIADSITFTSSSSDSDQSQDAAPSMGTFTFDMSACNTVEQGQEQDQDEKGQEQEEEKGQEQDQDEKGQEQEEGQEKEEEAKVEEECIAATATLTIVEIVEEEKGQEQEEEKGQEQEEEKGQEQDQDDSEDKEDETDDKN